MIFAAAQGAESLDYKIIVAVLAIVMVALKIVLDVLKWRRESSGAAPQDALQTKTLDRLAEIKAILDKENPITGQKIIYTSSVLGSKVEMIQDMLRDVRAQTGAILKILDEIQSRWSGPTNPGG